MQLFDHVHLVSVGALGPEVGAGLGFYYLLVEAILVHANKFI